MNKKRIQNPLRNLFSFLAVFSFIGCSYEFSEDNYTDITPANLENNAITLNSFTNLDTINVKTDFSYQFNTDSNQIIQKFEVLIDNQRIYSDFTDQIGTFTIDPSLYVDGKHTIKIEQTFNSGTGSLADQAQIEVFKATKEYPFLIHRNPSTPPAITNIFTEDGTIYLEWNVINETEYLNAYLSLQFKRRELRIPLTPEELRQGIYNDKKTVLYAGNTNSPNYDDFASVTYAILFESDYTEVYGTSQSLSYDPDVLRLKLSFVDFNGYKLKWTQHPQYGNFSEFEFGINTTSFKGSSEGGEYAVASPYIFGANYSSGGRPFDTDIQLPYFSFRSLELDEETFGLFNIDLFFTKNILYNPSTNRYYIAVIERGSENTKVIYVYEYTGEMEFIKKTSIVNYDNPRHEYINLSLDPIENNFYLDARFTSYLLDKTSLAIIDQYNPPTSGTEVLLRNNYASAWQYDTGILTITNLSTNTVLYSNETREAAYISPNGSFVYIQTQTEKIIYSIVNDQLVRIMDFDNDTIIHAIEGQTLYHSRNNEVFITDLNTQNSTSFLFGTLPPKVIPDSFSGKILLTQNGSNGIYDPQTGELAEFQSETFKQRSNFNEDTSYRLYLQNGRLIHSKGIYIDLD